MADESRRMAAFAQNHGQSDGGLLSALESLAARVTGSFRRDGGAAATASEEETVQTLSFATFVGESNENGGGTGASSSHVSVSAVPFAVPASEEMPPLPAVVKSVPPPPPLQSMAPLSSPSSPTFAPVESAFQTAPAMVSPSSPAGFTPWDDFAAPPSPPAAQNFQTMPSAPSANSNNNPWDDFGFSQSFQTLHMNARPPT
ncbi:hypothetical protein PINS_up006156 [Pythium insidiosum]|nr:hypothetical protein PINS_up006156 [Pythium insidiosum]